jgi:hypothetical protein
MQMTPLFATLVVATLIIAPAPEDKPKLPDSPPPRLVSVSAVDGKEGTCTVRTIIVKTVPVQEQVAINVNGRTVIETRTVLKSITEAREEKVAVKSSDVFDGEGKPVTEDDVWKRLTVGATIAIAVDSNKVNPAYLAAFKKETLIFVQRPEPPR